MKIFNINTKQNFGNVYALYGTTSQIVDTWNNKIINDLPKDSFDKNNIMLFSATDIYENSKQEGILANVAHEGKKVALIVTGEKDCNNVSFMEFGWTSLNGISQHILKAFNLDNINHEDIDEIKSSVFEKNI